MESGIICIAVVVWHISYDRVTEDWKVQGHNRAAVCIAALHVGAQTAWSHREDDRLCDAQRMICTFWQTSCTYPGCRLLYVNLSQELVAHDPTGPSNLLKSKFSFCLTEFNHLKGT